MYKKCHFLCIFYVYKVSLPMHILRIQSVTSYTHYTYTKCHFLRTFYVCKVSLPMHIIRIQSVTSYGHSTYTVSLPIDILGTLKASHCLTIKQYTYQEAET